MTVFFFNLNKKINEKYSIVSIVLQLSFSSFLSLKFFKNIIILSKNLIQPKFL